MKIATIKGELFSTYEHYNKQKMQAVELRLNMIIAIKSTSYIFT